MRAKRWRIWIGAAVVAASVASACSGSSSGDADDDAVDGAAPTTSVSSAAGAEVTGEVTGEVAVVVRADVPAPVAVELATPLTQVHDVSTTGAVDGEVQVRLPLTGPAPTADDVVFALTAEDPAGPWELVPVEIDGDTAVITTSHFSLFGAFRALFTSVTDLAREILDGLTADFFAEAEPPSCADEAGARQDGYQIGSDSGDTVYWCFGRDGQGRFLTLVNNRRYPLLVSHGRNATVRQQADLGIDFAEHLGSALAGGNRVVVPARESVSFGVDLGPGQDVGIATELDGVTSSLAQLQFGIETLVTILSRFGTRPRGDDAESRLLAVLAARPCLDAVARANAGSIIADCFDFDLLRSTFGLAAATLLTPIVTAAGIVSFFQTKLSEASDLIRGRDRYGVRIARDAVAPTGGVPPLTPEGIGPLRIGMTMEEAVATGIVGAFEEGCDIQSPPPLVAPLLPPYVGFVDVNGGVVSAISIGEGMHTSPGGVQPGDQLDEAIAAFEAAGLTVDVDTSTEEVFGSWFVSVLDGDTDVFGTGADPEAGDIGWITTPYVLACE